MSSLTAAAPERALPLAAGRTAAQGRLVQVVLAWHLSHSAPNLMVAMAQPLSPGMARKAARAWHSVLDHASCSRPRLILRRVQPEFPAFQIAMSG